MTCGKKLSWFELIPIFSYLFLEGKCLGCDSKISPQYFMVEALSGVLFSALFVKFGLSPFLPLFLLITVFLLAMAVYDLRHKIIPDGMVFSFDVLALVVLFFAYGFKNIFLSQNILDFLIGLILFIFFWSLWFFSKGKWMGLGDAKLALGVGWMLGFSGGIFALMIAFWMGAAWSLSVIFLQNLGVIKTKLNMKSEVPFGPFIIAAVYIQLLSGWNLSVFM